MEGVIDYIWIALGVIYLGAMVYVILKDPLEVWKKS